jgi:hypothetical protein
MFDTPMAIVVSLIIVGSFGTAILLTVLHLDLRRRHRKAKAMIARLVEERDTARRALAPLPK